MPEDNTTIFVPSELKGPVETGEHGPSEFKNFSGRFWIALVMALGFVMATTLVLLGNVKLDNNSIISVYTAFSTAAVGIVSLYMGQNPSTRALNNQPPSTK